MALDPDRLDELLAAAFAGGAAERRVVVRQAVDLDDSGQYERDCDVTLTAAVVVDELGDAPDESVVNRWNWWIGSLELAFGGYARFGVQAYRT
ncbi:uncharacterized protein Nmag_1317 [Natrialba magadii ATCC 43099]|uniref:Uncharacterized protein n=1 Tax=Natrialba magadii (strain ATCC 43099 / DSM 3394 / CCM 3739 / CIP 104546 / IAM 13178 / JCM 8861 / NBRC 102185 / NCIMB 2190 / MS3) TaxID=547559 RepID=D3SSV0_NATMM|nr:hypothetical protein [Natrialba magadii]ADD04896.1 uncharacterized protein Nmag_1317 [Natrialba magadii ATCC 43099]ELY23945.1 hypothetical protein C500_19105 [Natrialba magadii ATCC 43099]